MYGAGQAAGARRCRNRQAGPVTRALAAPHVCRRIYKFPVSARSAASLLLPAGSPLRAASPALSAAACACPAQPPAAAASPPLPGCDPDSAAPVRSWPRASAQHSTPPGKAATENLDGAGMPKDEHSTAGQRRGSAAAVLRRPSGRVAAPWRCVGAGPSASRIRLAPSTRHQAARGQHPAPSTQHPAPSTQRPAPSTQRPPA